MIHHADESLRALRRALQAGRVDHILHHAIRTRLAIRTVYRLEEQFGSSRSRRKVIALRGRGHDLLGAYLHCDHPIGFATQSSAAEHVAGQASTIAVLAALWQVSDALDEVENTPS